jgi:hypothetical protein
MSSPFSRIWSLGFIVTVVIAASVSGCDEMYPEVVVVNKTGEHVLLKDISFSGCIWGAVLAFDEATAPQRCLPGNDHIHFKKLDAHSYCAEQVEDGTVDGLCLCNPDTDVTDEDDTPAVDEGLINSEPNWFNYQTLSFHQVEYGDFLRIEITLDNLEQDFSVPGPYGH